MYFVIFFVRIQLLAALNSPAFPSISCDSIAQQSVQLLLVVFFRFPFFPFTSIHPPFSLGNRSLEIFKSVPLRGTERGSKWTKINSSKGFSIIHFRVNIGSHAATSLLQDQIKCYPWMRSWWEGEEGRRIRNNCATDYLYPGYSLQPSIRSHGSTIYVYIFLILIIKYYIPLQRHDGNFFRV